MFAGGWVSLAGGEDPERLGKGIDVRWFSLCVRRIGDHLWSHVVTGPERAIPNRQRIRVRDLHQAKIADYPVLAVAIEVLRLNISMADAAIR
ncbi:MAG: hypothetical protein M3198_13400 [Actinomycetota bacterium]|nr:hypothetical protein [Actinomycetota bacterium]